MTDTVSNELSFTDRRILEDFTEVRWEEPDQIIQEIPTPVDGPTESARRRLREIRSLSEDVIKEIDRLKQEVDKKGNRFEVSTGEPRGSDLFKAMYRVFGERTTKVTYEHYKRALELRTQLAKEDSVQVKGV